jgi:tetratricopeptide (TPR) repeat protein
MAFRFRTLTVGVVLVSGIACAQPQDVRTQALEAQNEAHNLVVEGRLDEAITQYSQAIALDPNIALIYQGRGVAYAGVQDYAAAIADFNRAIELDPDQSATYLERGRVYVRTEDFGAAEADVQHAIDISNSDPEIFYPAEALLASIRSGDAALDAAQ